MLSAKLLSCLAVVSAIVMASCEAHAEVAEPDEGSKVLTSPRSAISQHGTTRSLRTADATVAKANEERAGSPKGLGINRNSLKIGKEAIPSPLHDISTADLKDHINTAHPNAAEPNDISRTPLEIILHDIPESEIERIALLTRQYSELQLPLLKLANEYDLKLKTALLNKVEEVPAGDADKGKAAAVVGEKVITDEDVEKIRSDLKEVEADMDVNREAYLKLVKKYRAEYRENQNNVEQRRSNLGGGFVANGDKSKAAAGAHAGTDHTAV